MYKPVILIGNGARSNPALVDYLASLGIPILLTWMAADLLPEDHPAYCGRPGIIGQRAANIIQQKASQLFIFGARLDGDQTAYNLRTFAPNAAKMVYDIDDAELGKYPKGLDWFTQNINLLHESRTFPVPLPAIDPHWLAWCKHIYALYPTVLPEYWRETEYVNPFCVADWLSEIGRPDDVFAIGSSGQAPCTFYQAFRVKRGQRVCNISTYGAMGADIPMAIGACIGSGKRRTICVTGDGGFMLNVQELEVVRRLNLPIKFLVYNNDGYNSIRQMQNKRFEGRHVAADPESGLTLPPLIMLSEAFDIQYLCYHDNLGLKHSSFTSLMNNPRPVIIELLMDSAFVQYPRVDSSMDANGRMTPDSMEDMTPHLPADELRALMEWDG